MPLVTQPADPIADSRVASVAKKLGEQYIAQAATADRFFTISDPGPGVAIGNAAHIIASNWLIAVATGRRLVIRSPIIRGIFDPPANLSAEAIHAPHGSGRSKANIFGATITTYSQLKQFLNSHSSKSITGVWWHFAIWAQEEAQRTSILSKYMIEAGATRADIANDTFIAAVAYILFLHEPFYTS